MKDKGVAHIGIGAGKGDNKCIDAVNEAITSPLLETTIEGASHVIINISGDISLIEANEAATLVQELAGESANIIFGAVYEDSKPEEAQITVIATGLEVVPSMTKSVNTATTSAPSFLKKPLVLFNYGQVASNVLRQLMTKQQQVVLAHLLIEEVSLVTII